MIVADGRLTLVDFGYATPSWAAHVACRELECVSQSLWQHGDDEHALRSAINDVRHGLAAAANSGSM